MKTTDIDLVALFNEVEAEAKAADERLDAEIEQTRLEQRAARAADRRLFNARRYPSR